MLTQTMFTLSVTGHRDINSKALGLLSDEINEYLEFIKRELPGTKIRLISLMADGADRLVVKEAIANGIPVEALLPMPATHYKNDFNDKSKREFLEMTNNELVTVTELPLPEGIVETQLNDPGVRENIYARAGRYMSFYSDVIIALWDGKANNLVGGTYHILKSTAQNTVWSRACELEFKDDSYYKFSLRDTSSTFIYHIPTPRKSDNPDVFSLKNPSYIVRSDNSSDSIKHVDDIPHELNDLFHQIRSFSEDITLVSKDIKESSNDLTKEDGKEGTVSGRLKNQLIVLESSYTLTDRLALHFQALSDRSFKVTTVLAFVLGSLFLVYAKLFSNSLFLIAYLCTFGIGYLSYLKFRKAKYLEKHVKYRVIAETLRVKKFLTVAGIHNVREGYSVENFLKLNGKKEFRSLFSFIKNTNVISDTGDAVEIDSRMKQVVKEWVVSQRDYFLKKKRETEKRSATLEKINTIIILFSLIMVVGLIFLPSNLKYFHFLSTLSVKSAMTFLMGVLPMAVATFEHYNMRMAVSERAWQYNTMSDIFNRAASLLQETTSVEEYKKILKALGEEAISENMNWMVLRLQRELTPASGG